MASKGSNYWMDFFLDAKIPRSDAAKYTVIFTNNRIEVDMLGDLDKSALYDMGFTKMGDVLATIRQAKKVYAEYTQTQILGKTNLSMTTNRPKPQASSINKEPISGPSVSSSTSGSTVRTAKRSVASSVSDDKRGPMKVRRVINSVATSRTSNANITSSSQPVQAKVTFNSLKPGTSIRIGNTHQDSETRKVSVFNRLGDNESSSMNKLTITSREPKVTRTITGLKESAPKVKYSASVSVKDRLGGNQKARGGNTSRLIINSTGKVRQTTPQQSSSKISLKKSIFDRLGTKSF